MTGPAPTAAITATSEVRQDQAGNAVVVMRITCGGLATEMLIAPHDAERFGQGLADMLRQSGEQAKALMPGLAVPPKGLFIPKLNGNPRANGGPLS